MSILQKLFSKNNYSYKLTVYIDGMSCTHCSGRVEAAFNALPETNAKVNLEGKYAEVSTNKDLTDDEIKELVTNTGFTFVKTVR